MRPILLAVCASLALAGTGRAEPPANPTPKAAAPAPAQPVDPKSLKAWFPKPPSDWQMVIPGLQPRPVPGTSAAECEYTQDTTGSAGIVTIVVTDLAGTPEKPGLLAADFTSRDQTESDKGFEKPISADGFPGFAEYDAETQRLEAIVLVSARFTVELTISNLPPEALDAWLKFLPLKTLATLK
jgi:hypothetical protein